MKNTFTNIYLAYNYNWMKEKCEPAIKIQVGNKNQKLKNLKCVYTKQTQNRCYETKLADNTKKKDKLRDKTISKWCKKK